MTETPAAESPPVVMSQEQALLQFALNNPSVPKIYANIFNGFLNPHDVTLLFTVNGVPTGVVEISYPLAKALSASLAELVSKYEELSGASVKSATELESLVRSGRSSK